MLNHQKSEQLFAESQKYIPGGVNSPVRAFRSVGGTPVFVKRAKGAYLYDVDDNCYIDYVGSWGPMILGHAHPDVIKAVQDTAELGLSFGAPTELEYQLAKLITDKIPVIEQVRMVSSGTEATMSAIRLARGYTKRDKIIKFEGCYHGHGDALLVKAGSGALTFGQPSSLGVPADYSKHTLVLEYNNTQQLQDTFQQIGDEIATVIIEPIAGNMNMIVPSKEFMTTLRELCTKHGSVLIFDEVMTGFRVHSQGAYGLLGIEPDLVTLGKILGGGMPLGAFGGKKEIMNCIAPLGGVYQAGTLSGNPVAVIAGITTLNLLSQPDFYANLEIKTKQLINGLSDSAKKAGLAFSAQSIGGMFGIYFKESVPNSYQEVTTANTDLFNKFFHAMLSQGVYFAPSAYEAGFVSSAHTEEDIAKTLSIADLVFQSLK